LLHPCSETKRLSHLYVGPKKEAVSFDSTGDASKKKGGREEAAFPSKRMGTTPSSSQGVADAYFYRRKKIIASKNWYGEVRGKRKGGQDHQK